MPAQTRKAGPSKVTAPKPGPVQPVKAATFKLSDDDLASLKSTRGRKATPSIYLAEVKAAMQALGEPQGIKLTGNMKASKVSAELRKAAKELKIEKQITVFNREERGFVAFIVNKPKEEKKSDTTSQSGSRN